MVPCANTQVVLGTKLGPGCHLRMWSMYGTPWKCLNLAFCGSLAVYLPLNGTREELEQVLLSG